MRATLRIETKVLPGNKIEINLPSGCTQFLTNDRRLQTVPGLPVVVLDEVLTL